MGKLYKLRKAIEKDPEQWRSFYRGAEYAVRRPYWWKTTAEWYPRWQLKTYYDGVPSYRDFIESVLGELKNK